MAGRPCSSLNLGQRGPECQVGTGAGLMKIISWWMAEQLTTGQPVMKLARRCGELQKLNWKI